MVKLLKWTCVLTIIVLATAFFLWMLPRGPIVYKNSLQSRRGSQIVDIAHALQLYQNDHGKFPDKLSELVPGYIPVDRSYIFFPPGVMNVDSANIDSIKDRIDKHGMFIYGDARLRSKNILAYEISGTWNDHSGKYPEGDRIILRSDLSAIFAPPEELKKLSIPY